MERIFLVHEKRVSLKFSYNKEIVEKIKEIDGRVYLPSLKIWDIPLTLQNNQKIVSLIKKYNFIQSQNKAIFQLNTDNLTLQSFHKSKVVESLNLKPREYQNFAIDYMLTYRKVINGDDMGLGKTLETIFSVEIGELFPCLIVTLSSTLYHWENLWKQTKPDRKISVIKSGRKKQDFDADVIIMTYGMLAGRKQIGDRSVLVPKFDEILTIPFKSVTYDESHSLKNNKANRSKMAKKIAKGVDYTFLLTGTPILNRPIELVHPLNTLGIFSDIFGSWNTYVRRYCAAEEGNFGLNVKGASNALELNNTLKAKCYFRREKREVLKDLPDIQKSVLNIPISNKREYRNAEVNLIDYLEQNVSTMKARSAEMAEFLVLRNVLRQLSGKGKSKGIIEWIENWLEQSERKLIVFGIYKETLRPIADHFGSKVIDGSVSAKNKLKMIEDFQTNDQRVLFGNIMALGTGTDGLQNASSDMAIIELPEVPGILDQTISRLERSGQKNSINVNFLLSEDTIDADMWDSLEVKKEVVDAVNKGQEYKSVSLNDSIIQSFLNKK